MNNQQPSTSPPEERHPYARLLLELEELQAELMQHEQHSASRLQDIHPQHQAGSVNLVHYLALRQRDMRTLQGRLAAAGLSSLGRMEPHVLANIGAIVNLLRCALGKNSPDEILPLQEATGTALLEYNTNILFGKVPLSRRSRIMITLPSEVADDYALIKDMLVHGMDCARINCAHDSPAIWARMIEKIRLAGRETGRQCRILMDLGGPRLRTGEIAQKPAVLKWKPKRDMYGNLVAPARIWLHAESDPAPSPAPADASLPVGADWLSKAEVRDFIELTDARGALRTLQLVEQVGNGCWHAVGW